MAELAEELPPRHLYEATKKAKNAISLSILPRGFGFETNNPLLDWIYLPARQDIDAAVETALKTSSLGSKYVSTTSLLERKNARTI